MRSKRGSRMLVAALAVAALVFAVGFLPDLARERLAVRGVPFDADAFVEHAGRGDLGVVRLFLRGGMDPDAVASDGYTALMRAAERGDAALMEALLAAGAEPDFLGKYLVVSPLGLKLPRPVTTPLALAVRAGQVDAVRLLVRERAHERGNAGPEALAAAASAGRADVVGALLDGGVAPGGDPAAGASAVAAAVAAGQLDVARRLVDAGARLATTGPEVARALADAVAAGDVARVDLLLRAGAAPDGRDAGGRSLPVTAALGDVPALVPMLAEAGAALDVDTAAAAALLAGAAAGRGDGVRALVAAARIRGEQGPVWATLARALDAPAPDLETLLRELGLAPADVADLLLLDAARAGDAGRVRAVLAVGADPDVEGWDGRSAVRLALDGGHVDVVRLLSQAGARRPELPAGAPPDLVQALHGPLAATRRAAVAPLADGAAAEAAGVTPLMAAAWRGDVAGVRALLAAGANPLARDRRGASAGDLARTARAHARPIARKLAYSDAIRSLDAAAASAAAASAAAAPAEGVAAPVR